MDIADQNSQNRYQHQSDVTNTFRLRHPSPTLMLSSFEAGIWNFSSKFIRKKKFRDFRIGCKLGISKIIHVFRMIFRFSTISRISTFSKLPKFMLCMNVCYEIPYSKTRRHSFKFFFLQHEFSAASMTPI